MLERLEVNVVFILHLSGDETSYSIPRVSRFKDQPTMIGEFFTIDNYNNL